MVSNPFKINALTICVALAGVVAVELAAGWMLQWTPLSRFARIGVLRLIQTAVMLFAVRHFASGLAAMGWAPSTWGTGLKKGALWSIGFAVVAILGMVLLHLMGYAPLRMIRSPLPTDTLERITLFAVGGLIAPIAEEICFRGLLYAYFRRWGITVALLASTAIFVFLHFNRIPVTQVVGGIVFAVAYETSGNLMTPITIHVTGNLALFALSLPIFQS